jgi:PAS domain S-box-containing protein
MYPGLLQRIPSVLRRFGHWLRGEAQTRAIVDSMLDGVITIDAAGSIESVNPAAEQMFGWSAAQLLQRNISIIIPQLLFNADRTPPTEGTITAIGQREGGQAFPIEISIGDMHTDRAPGFVLIVRDIAERKRGEETLKHIGLGLSSATGEEFVKSLVQELSRALQTDYAFIIELHRKGERLSSTMTLAERGEMHTCAL